MAGRAARQGKAGLVLSESAWPPPPPGFVLRPESRAALYVAASLEAEASARGLESWEGWERALAVGASGSGRGASAVIAGRSGPRWRLKALRRGGLPARVGLDRYPSSGRLVAILSATVEAAARGVPTGRPVALIIDEGGPRGAARGALAVEEIEGSEDLAERVVRREATREDLVATLRAVRSMHDLGVRHPDLNLGNVLLRSRSEELPEVFLIDFDRATFAEGPLAFSARQAAVRRLERSCAKLTGDAGPMGPGTEDLWYDLYAEGDSELSRRFSSGRAAGRWALLAHSLGWRRPTP